MSHLYEVTAAGFDASSDKTDDRVFWVLAEDSASVREAIVGTRAMFWGQIYGLRPGERGVEPDFDLAVPGEARKFYAKLLEFELNSREGEHVIFPRLPNAVTHIEPAKLPPAIVDALQIEWSSREYEGAPTTRPSHSWNLCTNGALQLTLANGDVIVIGTSEWCVVRFYPATPK